VSDPVFFSDCPLLTREVPCKLQYLDLSMAVISEEGIETLWEFAMNPAYVMAHSINSSSSSFFFNYMTVLLA
jgi:hypothetical protein